MENHRIRRRVVPIDEQPTPGFRRYVLGPLEVLAFVPEVYAESNPRRVEYVAKIFAKLPSGHAILLYDRSDCNMLEKLKVGDTIICTNAIVMDDDDEQIGAYDVQDGIYIIRAGIAVEIPGYEPPEL